ncbi:MAG: DNA-processing protein DprA [Planctomycetota bacterium]|nr:DNA-processing protein DprA [Planctomycetota bacterium]
MTNGSDPELHALLPEPQRFSQEQLDYLQLVHTTGVGPQILDMLLEHFGNAATVLSASPTDLMEVPGVGISLSRRLRSAEFRERALEIVESCRESDVRILFPDEPSFPRLLHEIDGTPSVLFLRGELFKTDNLSVAIVGTRGATQYGRSQAERFARQLARAGLTVVSGLARGIDTSAHRGALEAGGRTIAVLANGVQEVYPSQNAELGEQIASSGALISEMPPGTKPKRGMFPQRNRIVTGISLGTIVIEAAQRSGALISARLAGEQGRDVFALPGMVTAPNSQGCHQIIRDGATLVQDPHDVIEALGPLVEGVEISEEKTIRNPAELQLNEQETQVLQAIGTEPTDLNNVVITSQLPVARVLSTISVLEMRRLVRRVSGQLVQRL